MSCGLGAVALIFLLVKHNIDRPDDNTSKYKDLKPQLEMLKVDEKNLESTLKDLLIKKDIKLLDNKKINLQLVDYEELKNSIVDSINENTFINKSLEKSINKIEVPIGVDKTQIEGLGYQNYLIGMEVKGQRIALIIDISASMTDETLIDIITRKNSSEEEIRKGPKWQRTIRIVKWMLSSLPKDSKLSVTTFSEEAGYIDNKMWYKNNIKDINKIVTNLIRVVPSGATNLGSALKKIAELSPLPNSLYVITDGLPTKGLKSYSKLEIFNNCQSIRSASNKITGECRVKLFWQSVNDFQNNYKDIVTNVILLPLEGDPEAAPNYWLWTAKSGGTLLVPSKDWP